MRMTWRRLIVLGGTILFAAASADVSLIDAARNADKDAVRTLLQKKVDVNAAEGDGTTALHWASYRDDLDSADLLIRAGANVDAANELGVTPLWTASQNGSTAMVAKLLAAGANPNPHSSPAKRRSWSPRVPANPPSSAIVGERQRARRARPDGADVGTAKHPDVVKVLVENGADVTRDRRCGTR